MKILVIITALALIISASTTAQVAKQSQQQSQKQTSTQVQTHTQDQLQTQDRVQKQERVQKLSGVHTLSRTKVSKEERKMIKDQKIGEKKVNHGQVVSETAKSTESGPGKGEVVSSQAKTQGQAQQARIRENISAKNQSINQSARGNIMQNRIRVPSRGGAGRK